MSRSILYFTMAVIPSLIQGEHPPAGAWDWFRLVGMAIYQGLLALKALQSQQTPPNQ